MVVAEDLAWDLAISVTTTAEVEWEEMIETRAVKVAWTRALAAIKASPTTLTTITCVQTLRTTTEIRMIEALTREISEREIIVMTTALLLRLLKFSLEALITVLVRMISASILNKNSAQSRQLKLWKMPTLARVRASGLSLSNKKLSPRNL
jgi:hypothetical protein